MPIYIASGRIENKEDGIMKLQQKRLEAEMTQQQLADASGVNVRIIQYYEQGYRDINGARVVTVKRLADALGCRIEELIEEQ